LLNIAIAITSIALIALRQISYAIIFIIAADYAIIFNFRLSPFSHYDTLAFIAPAG